MTSAESVSDSGSDVQSARMAETASADGATER
jgi:hypothetical protein